MKLVNVLLFSEPKNSVESLQLQYLVQQVADNPLRFLCCYWLRSRDLNYFKNLDEKSFQ